MLLAYKCYGGLNNYTTFYCLIHTLKFPLFCRSSTPQVQKKPPNLKKPWKKHQNTNAIMMCSYVGSSNAKGYLKKTEF